MTNPSKHTRIVATTGVGEESIAHIRLMLRMAEPRLTDTWRMGSEAEADFMLVEPGSVESDAALARFQNEGRAYGLMCDRDAAVAHGLVLWLPIKQEQLIALFNSISASNRSLGTPGMVAKFDENFYDAELEKQIPVGKKHNDDVWLSQADRTLTNAPAERRGFGPPELEGLDRLIQGDPTQEPPPAPEIRLDDSVTLVEMEDTHSIRSQQRGNESSTHSTALGNIGISPLDLIPISSNEPIPAHLLNKHGQGSSDGQPLGALLAEGALNRPTRISFGTHPALVLDPKPRNYYSQGALEDLSIYATELLPEANIDGIFGSELQQVRDASGESRSYDELLWLIALQQSRGTLDRKLDPGGSYRVVKPLSAAHRLRSHGAILGAMSSARPLHEISKLSGAPMVDVFDVINAYAAIDRVEVVPRQRLKNEDTSAMGKLSRLFGKK